MKNFIILMFCSFLLFACETSNEQKICGKWRGTFTQKLGITGKIITMNYEAEFLKGNVVYWKNIDLKTNQNYPPKIQKFEIVGDSLIFISDKKKSSKNIKFISDTKLVLEAENYSTKELYELEKFVK